MTQAAPQVKHLFSPHIKTIPTRDGYGEGLVTAGKTYPRVVALCADLTESTRTESFKTQFPDRFIEVGVAEQALVTIAAGLAAYGKIPFAASFAIFSPGRNWEQIRTTICLNRLPVKLVGSHAGIVTGPDGATHQALEDIALARVLPHMTVIVPCDAPQAKKATLAAAAFPGPVYLRLTRPPTPVITTPQTPFAIGKAQIFYPQNYNSKNSYSSSARTRFSTAGGGSYDVALIATGPLVYQALLAARDLEKAKIRPIVVNNHTIKPQDESTLIQIARQTGAAVTIEDHQISAGMGSAVAELLSQNHPIPIEFIGMSDSFGESGQPEELLEKYGLTARHIVKAAQKVIKRK